MGKKKGGAKKPTVGDKPFLHINLRAFSHATEVSERVREALANVAGYDLTDEDAAARFDKQTTTLRSQGHFNNPITIFEVELGRAGDVRRFWQRLFADATTKGRLAHEVDERLDDDLVFWLRLDKQAAYDGRLMLTQGDDVVQVRAKLATYPKDRDVGLAFLRDFLDRDAADQSST